jgi:putative membrane protein
MLGFTCYNLFPGLFATATSTQCNLRLVAIAGHMSDHASTWSGEGYRAIPVLVFAVLLACLVIQILWPRDKSQTSRQGPLEVLKKRYARGEITQDEYEQAEREIADQRRHGQ